MDFKNFSKTNTAFVLLNVLLAVIIGLVLMFAAVLWLSKYTHHGEEVVVPTVTGMYVEEAQILAGNEGLSIVVIDSTYSRTAQLGAIVEQNPRAESHAKKGRSIYVIVNAKAVRQVPVPDLRDVSFRQAEATLRALGLEVENVEYEPSEYKDLVLDLRYKEKSLEPGARISEGAKVTLVVGFGQGTEYVTVPDLTGMNALEMRSALLSGRLILGSVEHDTEVTDENRDMFVVYGQTYSPGSQILEGTRVDVKMTTDLQKAASVSQQQSEEDFF